MSRPSGMDFIARARRNYLEAQMEKPEGGLSNFFPDIDYNALRLAKKKVKDRLKKVQRIIDYLDKLPARISLLEKIKKSGRSLRRKDFEEAERLAEPTPEEKRIIDRLVFLIQEENNLESILAFLNRS